MALIEKLKNIANAIRSKTNKSEEMTLEQMASAIEDIKVGELDFSDIYDDDFSNEINQNFKDGIKYAKEIYGTYNNSNEKSLQLKSEDLVFLPNIKMEKLSSLSYTFRACRLLQRCGILDFQNCSSFTLSFFDCSSLKSIELLNTNSLTSLYQTFQGCLSLQKLKLTSLEKMGTFINGFTHLVNLEKLEFDRWKQVNINIAQSSKLSAESIHYIIQNAMSIADGATARTLTLHATAKANWEASEYYEQDLAVLEEKGITIA